MGAKAVKLIFNKESVGTAKVVTTYVIYSNGVVDVSNNYTAYTGNINRLGMSMQLVPGLENVEYFARGPWSNYIDRKTGSFAGIYKTTVTDMAEHFVKPQSSGNREDLRYVKFTSVKDPNFGLIVETEGPTSFSALHYTEEDLGTAMHDFELTPRKEIIVHLDRFQQGIGNGSCGSTIWARYQTPVNQELRHTLRLTPLTSPAMGYTVPDGNAGAYLTQLSATDFEMTAAKAPAELYTLLDKSLKVSAGTNVKLTAKASETANMAAWIDLNNDFQFSDTEKLSLVDGAFTLDIPSDVKHGNYRLRIVLDSSTPKADGPVASGRVYDVVLNVVNDADGEIADYIEPKGTIHDEKKAYLTKIETSGADEDIVYDASTCPRKVYTCVDDVLRATAGSSFDLRLVANQAGPRSTSTIYQDLRYNYAVIYADFMNNGEFTELARYGRKITGANNLGNYDEVMDINYKVVLPINMHGGHARIRVIYQNAWKDLSDPNAQNIHEGVAYDIPMIISTFEGEDKPTTLPERIEGHPDGTVHPDGKAYVKRIVSTKALEDIDVKWESQPGFYTLLDDAIVALPGSTFTVRMTANRLGGTGKVYQDLRYNYAMIFVDWEGFGLFNRMYRVGDILKGESVDANYSDIMSLSFQIDVPEQLHKSKCMIRVIYQNAWQAEPDAYSQDILEGCAYDIPLNVGPKEPQSEISEIISDAMPEGIYDLNGRRLLKPTAPGIYIVNGKKTLVK